MATKKKKLQTKACKKTLALPLNDYISPSNERNDKEPSPSFQEKVEQQQDYMTINS